MKFSNEKTREHTLDSPGERSPVMQHCEECQRIIERLGALDQALLSLPEGSPDRDALWDDLMETQEDLPPAARRLAAARARTAPELQAKAGILAALLRINAADAAPDQDVLDLALSVAEDVARMI